MSKKLLGILLAVCTLLSVAVFAFPASAAGEAVEIDSETKLLELMNDSAQWDGDYVLTKDLDLSTYEGDLKQKPIGTSDIKFSGTFDGNEKKISGVNISGTSRTGFFGYTNNATIKNLTIEGTVTCSGQYVGGLIGVTYGNITLENCVNKCEVISTYADGASYTGGLVGYVNMAGSYSATIKDCTNYGNITFANARVGGIIGAILTSGTGTQSVLVQNCVNASTSITSESNLGGLGGIVGYITAGITAATTITVDGCENKTPLAGLQPGGIVGGMTIGNTSSTYTACSPVYILNCKNSAAITATPAANTGGGGGIVGMVDNIFRSQANPAGVPALTIKGCRNDGAISCTISSAKGVAGILGRISAVYSNSVQSEIPVHIEDCLNTGSVTTSGGDAGGIAGYMLAKVAYENVIIKNCLNTGDVTATASGTGAGGITGLIYYHTVDNCVNTGTISGGTSGGIAGRSSGSNAPHTIKNCYTSTSTVSGSTAVTTSNVFAGDGAIAQAKTDLASNTSWIIVDGHDLDLTATHVHDENYDDGDACWCGAIPNCTHTSKSPYIIQEATCSTTGLKNLICDKCHETTDINLPIEINPNNHEQDVAIKYDAEKGKIVYVWPCCGAEYFVDEAAPLTTVYVNETTGTAIADIKVSLGSAEKPFKNFAEAMMYAAAATEANGDVTLQVVGKVTVPAQYASPACEHTILVTGKDTAGNLHFATGTTTEFRLNGPIMFENLSFTSETEHTSSGGAWIFAQNHKLVMGEGLTMDNDTDTPTLTNQPPVNSVKMYVCGGFNSNDITNAKVMNTDITVRSGEYWFIGGWNRNITEMSLSGTGKMTIGGTANAVYTYWLVGYSTGKQSLSADSKVTMILDGKVECLTFVYETQNAPAADVTACCETDLVFTKNAVLNCKATEILQAAKVSGAANLLNTVLNLYVDERSADAIAASALFDATRKVEGVTSDSYITNTLKTTVNPYTYTAYCHRYLDDHTYDAEDMCTVCGMLKREVSATLDDVIGLNFYIDMGYYATATGVTLGNADGNVDLADEKLMDDGRTRFTFYVVPAKIDTAYTFTLVDTDFAKEISVAGYLADLNEKATEEQATLKTLATALIDYGSYSQKYFANKTTPAEENAALQAVTAETLETYKADVAPVYSKTTIGALTLKSNSFVFTEAAKTKHYFTLADGGDIAEYTFTYQFDGEDAVTVDAVANGSRYMVTIPGIDAKRLSKTYTLTITKDGEEDMVITYSALSYAYLLLQNSEVESLKPAVPLAKALYLYSAAADAYAK